MLKVTLLAAAAAVTALAAPAGAQVTFNAGSGMTAPGTTVFEDFEGFTAGDSLGTNGQVLNTTVVGTAARPAFGSTGNFAAVLGDPTDGSYTVNFDAARVFSFVIGSVDTYNSLTLGFDDMSSITYLGGQIINDLTFPSGNQISGETNGVVSYNFSSGPKITSATFGSTENSFEFDNLAIGGVPEPTTWGMMILGLGAIGFALRGRRQTGSAFA